MRSFRKLPELSRDEMLLAANTARQRFREERVASERRWSGCYDEHFETARRRIEHVLERTDCLLDLETGMGELLGSGYLDVLRYMCRPTVSSDDFANVSDIGSVAPSKLRMPEAARKAAAFFSRNLNGSLFPWVERGALPDEADLLAACRAVAALVADQKTKTSMRIAPSRSQEEAVRSALVDHAGFARVPSHDIATLADVPAAGEVFAREASVGGVKADVVLGLHDGRFMALECKVSNSGINSYKRLNHEVTDKVEKWYGMFGRNGIVGGCVLQGVYELENLMSAQEAGVGIFWSHDLDALVRFVERTRWGNDGA